MAGSILRRSAVYPRRMSDFRGTIHQCECPEVAASRRPANEIHPWVPNGDLRPYRAIRLVNVTVRFLDDSPHQVSDRGHQLGKLIAYPQTLAISRPHPSVSPDGGMNSYLAGCLIGLLGMATPWKTKPLPPGSETSVLETTVHPAPGADVATERDTCVCAAIRGEIGRIKPRPARLGPRVVR